jgi:CubicO group peptidase (beta-lactamase class C family)
VIGCAPRTRSDLPHSLYEYLATLEERSHGGPFSYRSCETDVLGWVCERASRSTHPELLSGVLWSKLLPEQDMAAGVDPAGAVLHDGGLCATLRNVGRFGQMLLDGGCVGDAGGQDSREAFEDSVDDSRLPGGRYRNQFWAPFPDRNALLCLGIHGYLVYVEPAKRLVVKLSSWPQPQKLTFFLDTLAAVKAHRDCPQTPPRVVRTSLRLR